MIELGVSYHPADQDEVDRALRRLDHAAGCYVGVDAGIAGMHPLQASLLAAPALVFRLNSHSLSVQVLSPWGEALLAMPLLRDWRAGLAADAGVPGAGIAGLRSFLTCFARSPDVLLMGALQFEAHRLARDAGGEQRLASSEPLGLLYFGPTTFRRDAQGVWQRIVLTLPDPVDTKTALTPDQGIIPAAMDLTAPSTVPGNTTQGNTTQSPTAQGTPLQDDHPPGGYARMVARALAHLTTSPLVSLTLSQSYRRAVSMPASQAFARLRAANPAPASFFVSDGQGWQLLGASPDLQLVVQGLTVQALPVCGTVQRRPGAVGEAESLKELINEDVDAASLAVCTDALRNDLSPLCEPGSLTLLDRRRPMALSTVVHTVDRLQGRLRQDKDAWDAIVATAAPVMVTGTPRAAALAAIDQLEASPRGWYGGLMVQVASNGDALAGTILRAASVKNGVAEVRTGGDLLADSTPEREEAESRLKTLSVWRAFGLEPDRPASEMPQTCALPASVRLIDIGDAFGAALRDCIAGLGIAIQAQDIRLPSWPPDHQTACTVLAGTGLMPVTAGQPAAGIDGSAASEPFATVAIGDAAVDLLARCGAQVTPCEPEHGRLLTGFGTAQAPWQGSLRFTSARYATRRWSDAALPAGWQVWATDDQGAPLALAHPERRLVCLGFRPDSLLSDDRARMVLRFALAFAANTATTPPHPDPTHCAG